MLKHETLSPAIRFQTLFCWWFLFSAPSGRNACLLTEKYKPDTCSCLDCCCCIVSVHTTHRPKNLQTAPHWKYCSTEQMHWQGSSGKCNARIESWYVPIHTNTTAQYWYVLWYVFLYVLLVCIEYMPVCIGRYCPHIERVLSTYC